MIVKIKPKDSTSPVFYEKVLSHFLEGNTLGLLFEDGSVRNIPLIHIWYYETTQPRMKTQTTEEQ